MSSKTLRQFVFLLCLLSSHRGYPEPSVRVVDENDETWGIPSILIDTMSEIRILETDEKGYLLGELPTKRNQKIRVEPGYANSYKPTEIVLPYSEKFIYLPKTRNGTLAYNTLTFMQKGAPGDAALAFGLLEDSIKSPEYKLSYKAQSISLSLPIMLGNLSESGVSVGITPAELPRFSPGLPNVYQEFFSVTADGSYYGLNPKIARIVGEYNKLKGIQTGDSYSYQTLRSLSSYSAETLFSEIVDKETKIPQELFQSMATE